MSKRPVTCWRRTIEEDDVRAVMEALRSEAFTDETVAEELEEAIKSYTGARYAVCCSNVTAALHMACLAAGLGKGNGIVTSPLAYLSSSNCALYVGATPVFAEVEDETFNMDPDAVEERVRKTPGIKAIIPAHFAGTPCRMERLSEIARRYGLVVIEDASCALGAMWRDQAGVWRKAGSSHLSDMTVLSFNPSEPASAGDGGAVTTSDPEIYERLKLFRNHGVAVNNDEYAGGECEPVRREMLDLGFNYSLSGIQCALGLSQIKKAERFLLRRNEIASLYGSILSRRPYVKTPPVRDGVRSSCNIYPVRIDFGSIGVEKKKWFELMKVTGVRPDAHFIPAHMQPYYKRMFGCGAGDFPVAESFYRNGVCLPIDPLLTDEEVGAVTDALMSTLAYAARTSGGARGAVDGILAI